MGVSERLGFDIGIPHAAELHVHVMPVVPVSDKGADGGASGDAGGDHDGGKLIVIRREHQCQTASVVINVFTTLDSRDVCTPLGSLLLGISSNGRSPSASNDESGRYGIILDNQDDDCIISGGASVISMPRITLTASCLIAMKFDPLQ